MASIGKQSSADTASAAGAEATTPVSHFYRVVWRWHFYAGLLVIPIVVILAITGIIYLFGPQINGVLYGKMMHVEAGGQALPYSQQLESVSAAYPDATPTRFRPSVAADSAAEVGLTTADDRALTAYADPYTGTVTGDRFNDQAPSAIAEKIHGTLLIGNLGDYIVELAACWALVLVITGLYLWFPRKRSAIWGTLVPRLGAKGRTRWRDLHAVTGFYGSLLVIFMILSGLPWSGFWGEKFSGVWNQYPLAQFEAKSTVPTGSLNEPGAKIIPWATELMPIPSSTVPGDHAEHGGMTAGPAAGETAMSAPQRLDLDSVIRIAEEKGIASGFSVRLPQDETGVYTVSASTGSPVDERTMHIDQYSGAVLAEAGWQQYGAVPKAVSGGIQLHQGTWFGLPNQLLMLGVASSILVLAVTAPIMWWKRRPAGRLGAPAMPENFPVWKGAVAIMIVLGVVFPFVGISLLAILLFEFLVIRRIPVLQRTFA